jgi:hypothetical protein
MRILKNLLTLSVLVTFVAGTVIGQTEHPEHPEGQEHPDKEHPDKEHPEDKSAEQELTVEQFADAAENYIKQKTEEKGHFPVTDKKQDKELELKLIKIHRKRLSHLGNNLYFVCADFQGQDGNTYDVDIFMKGTSKDDLKATRKPMVHKVNGNERFSWYQADDGTWKRRGHKKKGKEHPESKEHPDKEHPEHPEGKEHPEHPEN